MARFIISAGAKAMMAARDGAESIDLAALFSDLNGVTHLSGDPTSCVTVEAPDEHVEMLERRVEEAGYIIEPYYTMQLQVPRYGVR